MLLRCLTKDQAPEVLSHFHDAAHARFHSGGHFTATETAHKILHYGYYWPTIFKDSFEHVRNFRPCQYASGRQKLAPLPLHTVVERVSFFKWGLDFIGPISPPSSASHIFILTATDYFTRWTEAVALKNAKAEQVVNFLQDFIFSCFGISLEIVSDNGGAFVSKEVLELCRTYNVICSTSSPYYPRGNGLAESTHKNLLKIIKRVIGQNPREWHLHLNHALWADRTTTKTSHGETPFHLVYGQEAIMPAELEILTYRLAFETEELDVDPLTLRFNAILALEEQHKIAHGRAKKRQ